jgi:hypothetical protein
MLIACRRRRVHTDVGKTGDACLAGRGIVASAMERLGNQIYGGTAGLTEAHECADPALVTFGGCAGLDRNAHGVEFGRGGIERVQILQLESDGMIVGRCIHVHESVIPVVGPQVGPGGIAIAEFEP